MAVINSTIKRKTATGYQEIHPKTHADQVEGLATALAGVTIDSLNEILDVNAPSPSDGQALVWDNGTSKWKPLTIAFTDTNTTYTAGTGLSLTGTEFANTAPDQTVVLTGSGATTVTGTYPNFTISSTDTNTTYDLSPYAPLASPALTGVPTAPTTATSDDSTRIATTAYVKNNIEALIGGAPTALDTLNELAAALADDADYAATITTALAAKVNTSSLSVAAGANTVALRDSSGNLTTAGQLNFANNDGFVYNDTSNIMYVKKDGTDRAIITDDTIGSQSVNYATSAGNADTVDNYHIVVGSTGTNANTLYFVT